MRQLNLAGGDYGDYEERGEEEEVEEDEGEEEEEEEPPLSKEEMCLMESPLKVDNIEVTSGKNRQNENRVSP